MSLPCIPCAPPQVCNDSDLDSYSLQDDVFYDVFCQHPPCGRMPFIYIACCDNFLITIENPDGDVYQPQIMRKVQAALKECVRRKPFCEPPVFPPPEPPPPIVFFFSAPKSCTVSCPDGTPFTYSVSSGLFIAETQAKADALAKAYVCENAPIQIFCLSSLVRCGCLGTPFSVSIPVSPPKSVKFVLAAGTLPPGLTFPAGVIGNGVLRITGTPLLAGTYSFSIRAIDSNGSSIEKPYVITIAGITTTSIPDFTVGTPYSFQLVGVGLGNLTYSVFTGTLPAGLSLSSTGLISGTPTLGAVTSTVEFALVDDACEEPLPRTFVPRAQLVTSSSTRIETRIGWPDFLTGDTLYKTATYAGEITQIAFPNFNADETINETQCGGAKYTYSGFDQINNSGGIIARHAKDVTMMCVNTAPGLWSVTPDPNNGLLAIVNRIINPGTLRGFCWDANPDSCIACDPDDTTWASAYNAANFGPQDLPNGITYDVDNFTTDSGTMYTYDGDSDITGGICIDPGTVGFPTNTGFGTVTLGLPYVRLESTGLYTVTLSDPFTDADANSTAVTYNSLLAVAQNKRTTQVVNTLTRRQTTVSSVAYSVVLSNLVVGSSYIAHVQLWYSGGARTVVSIPFVAVSTTQNVAGVVPTPSLNTTITVKNPSVVFA